MLIGHTKGGKRSLMVKLRVLAFGTADFLTKYSNGLRQDCEKFNYDCVITEVPKEAVIGRINQHVFDGIIEHLETQEYDRILLMDPECRILKPIPNEWLNTDHPVIFRKVRTEDGTPDAKFTYWAGSSAGNQLPCRIICQPMILSKADVKWIKLAHDLSVAASDIPNGEYVRNEMFLETAIDYTKTKTIDEYCVYNRKAKIPHKAVKGTWHTEDTIIQHPELHSLFDTDIVASRGKTHETNFILPARAIDNNVVNIETAEKINEAMWKERTSEWLTFEQWQVQPSTGRMKYKNFKGIVYHHSISNKIKQSINTPAVKQYKLILTKNLQTNL